MNLQALAEQPFELLVELERLARAAIAARDGAPAAADEWVGIGFRLGAESFVTSRGDVREVLPVPEQVTRVPGAKPWLRGIANLRGQLLTVVDLKSFLGAGSANAERQARVLSSRAARCRRASSSTRSSDFGASARPTIATRRSPRRHSLRALSRR